jgi:hypothetical protein
LIDEPIASEREGLQRIDVGFGVEDEHGLGPNPTSPPGHVRLFANGSGKHPDG